MPSATPTEPTAHATKPSLAGWRFLVFVLLAVTLPAMVPGPRESVVDTRDKKQAILTLETERIAQENPEMIVIGDSMVPCRVDAQQLGTQLGKRVSLLSSPGSASAAWFLLFKNIAARHQPTPSTVVFFFRDTYFHQPTYRTDGQRGETVNNLKTPREPEFDLVVLGKQGPGNTLIQETKHLLDGLWQIDAYHDQASRRVREIALDISTIGAEHTGKTAKQLETIDRYFNRERNLRDDLANDLGDLNAPENLDSGGPVWDISPTASFLPHIERLASELRIKLIFYRVKQRYHTEPGAVDSTEVAKYMQEMADWRRARGHGWADESKDNDIGADDFTNGDHIKVESLERATTGVARRIQAAQEAR